MPDSPFRSVFTGCLFALAFGVASSALAAPAVDEVFQNCVAGLRQQAVAAGIGADVANETLSRVRFEQQVIDADRRQPEFTDTFANYLGRRLTSERIERGRRLLAEHRPLLQRIEARYGVPAQYLVSFWGLETNFGSYFGTIPVLNSLTTLACDERRATYFTTELLNALRIIEKNELPPERMVGSWAGAMGHTQFMPSVWLRYAVDGDGDGRIDLWRSIPDALTSAAHFLSDIGWRGDERWGREVRLPAGFDYTLAGRAGRRPVAAWRELGVTTAAGKPLPVAAMEGTLVVPSGHRGPAFLVYANFDAIMRWNRSEFYALSVGLLADSIAGGGALQKAPPTDLPRLSRAQVESMQTRLGELGFDAGTPDGVFGPATRTAIRAFQHSRGWIADGYPDGPLLAALGVVAE